MAKKVKSGQVHLTDVATRHQVYLERLKTGQIKDFGEAFDAISAGVTDIFKALDVGVMSELTKKELTTLLVDLRQMQTQVFDKHIDDLLAKMESVAAYEVQYEARALMSAATRQQAADVNIPQAQVAYQRARLDPIHAAAKTNTGLPLLEDFVNSIQDGAINRINSAVLIGFDQGQTVPSMLKQLLGTGRLYHKDGVQEVSKRQAYTVIRTATQHVANTAREVTWNENSDLVKGVIWVSTLDSRTTIQCQALDGRHFPLDSGPRPPIHPNCRSTTAPWMDDTFDFLDAGATRSSLGGYVDQNQTYYDWLQKQPEAFQDDALGETRAKLFRDGGLSTTDFAALQLDKTWQPMTLDEMRTKEPAAFERAGIHF